MSLATKYSSSPRPITAGGPQRAATILLRIARRKNRQGVDAVKLLHRLAHGFFERAAFLHIFLHQVRDDFGVGLGDELVAFGDELFLQLHVIFDDSVVDDHDLPVQSRCGWAFSSVGRPCVAQRVWPMPYMPSIG